MLIFVPKLLLDIVKKILLVFVQNKFCSQNICGSCFSFLNPEIPLAGRRCSKGILELENPTTKHLLIANSSPSNNSSIGYFSCDLVSF